MRGLGLIETSLLIVMGLLLYGGVAFAIIMAVSRFRGSNRAAHEDDVGELRAEVQRHREEVERLRDGSA